MNIRGIGQAYGGAIAHATTRDIEPFSLCGHQLQRITYDASLLEIPEMLRCNICNDIESGGEKSAPRAVHWCATDEVLRPYLSGLCSLCGTESGSVDYVLHNDE